MTQRTIFYHTASPLNREAIRREGLKPGQDASYGPPAIYLWNDRAFAESYYWSDPSEILDVWQVRAYFAEPDPEDPISAVFTRETIWPERLKFIGTFSNGVKIPQGRVQSLIDSGVPVRPKRAVQSDLHEQHEKVPRMTALDLALALDTLHEPLAFWVHYNDPEAKRGLLRRYDALPARQRDALERAVEEFFSGWTITAYRRLKPGDRLDRMGGASLTSDRPTHATFEVFELDPKDVLIHWAVTYPDGSPTPLGSKAFGHEREIILRPDARPRHVGSGRTELREHADDSAFGDIARRRVYEPLRGERIVHAETVEIQMAPALVEDWALFVTEGKDAGSGYLDAGRILIAIQPQLDGEPLAGLVWFKEYGKKKITHVWIDPDVQRRGLGHALVDAYRRHVSRKVIMVGPFSEAGLSFAKRIGAKIER